MDAGAADPGFNGLSLLVCVVVTGVVRTVREWQGRPMPVKVVAYRADDKRAEWIAEASNVDTADYLIGQMAAEIQDLGSPRSLTAPPVPVKRSLIKRVFS